MLLPLADQNVRGKMESEKKISTNLFSLEVWVFDEAGTCSLGDLSCEQL
jgi:hypothetical protein